jgi:hypothetical protein
MSGLIQRARILEAAMNDRIEQDRKWFAERHTELRQMRDIFRGDD